MVAFTNLFNNAAREFSHWLSSYGDTGQQSQAPTVPMQSIFSALEPGHYTLTEVGEISCEAGLSFGDFANWIDVYAPHIQVEVRPQDIDWLKQGLEDEGHPPTDQPLKATGSHIQWEFNPWTTMYNVEATLQAIAGPTEMQGAVFVSAANEDRAIPMDLGTMKGVNLDGFSIRHPNEVNVPSNITLSLAHSDAKDGQFVGNNNRLIADSSNVSGLNAEGSRALALELRAVTAEQMQLDGVSLAPGSAIEGSHLSGSMKGSIVGDLSVRNSYLKSAGMFEGTDISHVNFDGSIPLGKEVFAGAIYEGKQLEGEALDTFWQEKTQGKVFGSVGQTVQADAPKQQTQQAIKSGDLGALSQTDGLLKALEKANHVMLDSAICRSAVDVGHDLDVLQDTGISCAQNNEINDKRVEHESGIGPSRA